MVVVFIGSFSFFTTCLLAMYFSVIVSGFLNFCDIVQLACVGIFVSA